ncbi:NCS2 family nucleobase:cation symporter-2 [Friedmanniella endophytica]|uniref:NCS2 family nucleobase:cation symporter-2 n=1 Tax=Microlunatus kandeliicorticis TaxID=1759536 RepID=A0A7W3IUM8_9ACTN|nr:nucleobase:cation symporter-2 family protein [Microlunatus kandeliicorticis]MBA8795485.1 NCS2 family nucleobase:cation symporter-2 [Microlunatus kandeliicorticis]
MTSAPPAVPTAPRRFGRPARSGRPEDEYLGLGRSLAYGAQHVLTMYGGIIAPPLIVGGAAGLPSDRIALLVACCLFIGGLATVLQSFGLPFFGSQLPLVQGTSFAGVATMATIAAGGARDGSGLPVVFGAVLLSSVIGLLLTPFFARVIKFFPPVVAGVVITSIGLSLFPVAANWALGNDSKAPGYGSTGNIGLAGLTLLIVIVLSKVGVAAISRLSILLAIVLGTVIAAVLGRADFSGVGTGPVVAFPTPLAFGMPRFELAATVSLLIVVLVAMTETTADILAVGEIVGTRVDKRRIGNGLRADMLSSAIAPLFNGFHQTAFAQNVGLVAITRVKSRYVVTAGGLILLVLGLLPVLGRVVAAIPYPVLGGAGLVLFGTVTASGIRTLAKVDYEGNLNLVIVAISLGVGLIPVASPDFWDRFPGWFQVIFHSGISSAALMAIVLNLVFHHLGGTPRSDPSVFAKAPVRSVRYEDLTTLGQLREGDRITGGRIVDADGNNVPVVDAAGSVVDCRVCDTAKDQPH